MPARKIVLAAQRREARREGRYGPRKALPVMAGDLPVGRRGMRYRDRGRLRGRAAAPAGDRRHHRRRVRGRGAGGQQRTGGGAGRRGYSGHSVRRGGATSMLRAGAFPLNVRRHGRWTDGSRSFAGYVEEATGFGDGNPTKGLL